MSNTIQTAMVQQYNSNVTFLYQQMSTLKGLMREESLAARYGFFERMGPTEAVKKTVRHGATPQVNSQHTRRRGELVDYEWADLIDPQDEMRILINPTSAYTVNAATALGRAYDREAIAAFDATSYEGEDGTTATVFPSGNTAATGSTGLTVAKLKTTKLSMDVVPVPQSDRHFLVSPEGVIDLLADPQVTSADYNIVQALVSGQLSTQYMGFTFHTTTLLPIATNDRSCFAWHRDAMGMLIGKQIQTKISERADLSYATQIYACASYKGIRILDEGVWEVLIDESV